MIIRYATENDINDIMQIEKDSFAPGICETREVFLERLRFCDKYFLIAEDKVQDKVFAYCVAEKWRDIPENDDSYLLNHHSGKTHIFDGSVLYLSSFALLGSYRGKGMGKRLFDLFLQFFIDNDSLIKKSLLLVNEEWKSAIAIYKAKGFVPIKRINNFFIQNKRKTSAFVMKKEIR